MRFVVGFFSGVLGLLAGWAGLAFLVIALAGPDRDGGIAMGAFFNIGPMGGLVGFVVGVLLFVKFGLSRRAEPALVVAGPEAPAVSDAPPSPTRSRVSIPFAVIVLLVVSFLAWWGWYELIRSPYLTHGDMTLDLQFRLPDGMALPADVADVQIDAEEDGRPVEVQLGPSWRAHEGSRAAILATASLSRKSWSRNVTLSLPGIPQQTWSLDLPSDPDPTPAYTPWRLPVGSDGKIEMNYRLEADR